MVEKVESKDASGAAAAGRPSCEVPTPVGVSVVAADVVDAAVVPLELYSRGICGEELIGDIMKAP